MKKGKERTKVEKAVDVLFEEDLDLSTVLGKGGLLKEFRERKFLMECVLQNPMKYPKEQQKGLKNEDRTHNWTFD